MKLGMTVERNDYANSSNIKAKIVQINEAKSELGKSYCANGLVETIYYGDNEWMDRISILGYSYKNSDGFEQFSHRIEYSVFGDFDRLNELVKKATNLRKKLAAYDLDVRKIESFAELVNAVAKALKIDYFLLPPNEDSAFGYRSIPTNAIGLDRLEKFSQPSIVVENPAVEAEAE